MSLEELADLDFGKATFSKRAKSSFLLLILMVLNVDIAIVRCSCSCAHFRPEVNIIKTTVWLSSRQGVTVLAFACLRVLVIENVKVSIP